MRDAYRQLSDGEIFDISQLPVGFTLESQQLLGSLFQCLPGIGESQRIRAVEQNHIEFLFHIGDVIA